MPTIATATHRLGVCGDEADRSRL